MRNWKKMIVTAAVFGSLALLAGCTTASAVSPEEAKDLVEQAVGVENAAVTILETGRDDGVYELEVVIDGVRYEFEVDSATGQVREAEREDEVPPSTAPAQTVPAETQPARISLEEAKAIAYAHAGVSESDARDQSWENDEGMYEIDFSYGGWDYEYDIAYDGTIVRSEKEREDDHHADSHHATQSTQTSQTQTSRISAEEAWSIALAHAGVSDVRDRDWEWDDGCWELSFDSGRTEYEYRISADGTILHWEKEQDD